MLRIGMPGTGDIPITGTIFIERTPIGAITTKGIVMTGGSMNSTIMARAPGGTRDTALAARHQPTPGDLNPVQVM